MLVMRKAGFLAHASTLLFAFPFFSLEQWPIMKESLRIYSGGTAPDSTGLPY